MSTTFTTVQDATSQRAESEKLNASRIPDCNAQCYSSTGLNPDTGEGSSLDAGSLIGNFASAPYEYDKDSALGDESAITDELATTNDSALANEDEGNDSGLPEEDTKPNHLVDAICMATKECVTGSGHHRQVISHIFGRNKNCTRDLRGNWIMWCRQHYQRFCYRANKEGGNWALSQLSLARDQLQKFEAAGIVRSWTIALRKREQDALDAENTALLVAGSSVATVTDTVWERFLVPYLGHDKTFADVRDVLDAIEEEFDTPEYMAREKKKKVFPGVEFLATLPEAKVQKPAAKVKMAKSTPKVASTKAATTKATSNKVASTKAIPTKAQITMATSSKPPVTPTTKQAVAPRLGSFKRKAPSSDDTAYDTTETPAVPRKKRRLAHASSITNTAG
ncbi:hypothetical protein P7C71_g2670, partial [Lecanoromycetidae sp. Uapishka_2]